MAATRLLLWRHGRTEWNATRRIQGQADVDLDDVGIRQAQQAATLLAKEKPDVIIASDLARTRATAQPLAELLNLEIYLDKRLRERHFGPWQGLTTPELLEQYPQEYAAWKQGSQPGVPGIENNTELSERVLEGVKDAVATYEGTVCLVTHGGAAYRAVIGLLELPLEVAWRLQPLGNCRWADLRDTSRGWRLHGYNVGPASGVAGPQTPTTAADVEPNPDSGERPGGR